MVYIIMRTIIKGGLMKRTVSIICLIIICTIVVSCANNTSKNDNVVENTESEEVKTFTLDDLSKHDGKDGNSAYVAVNGLVYDVTDITAWSGGEHNGNMAGKDLTEVIENISPHGISVLEKLEVVGELIE